jgi:hypothetical protein
MPFALLPSPSTDLAAAHSSKSSAFANVRWPVGETLKFIGNEKTTTIDGPKPNGLGQGWRRFGSQTEVEMCHARLLLLLIPVGGLQLEVQSPGVILQQLSLVEGLTALGRVVVDVQH